MQPGDNIVPGSDHGRAVKILKILANYCLFILNFTSLKYYLHRRLIARDKCSIFDVQFSVFAECSLSIIGLKWKIENCVET